jgi:hypothetical protein
VPNSPSNVPTNNDAGMGTCTFLHAIAYRIFFLPLLPCLCLPPPPPLFHSPRTLPGTFYNAPPGGTQAWNTISTNTVCMTNQ